MIQPLQQGDKIAIIASSGKIDSKSIEFAVRKFESWGLEVILGRYVFASFMNFAGSDSQRLEDLQSAIDNPDIKAVFFARGGYGLVRIIDKVDFSRFYKQPKWICGYSDITVLLNHMNVNKSIPCIHGSMPINFENNTEESLLRLHDILFYNHYQMDISSGGKNNSGECSGEIIGGNLSVFYGLMGTNSWVDPKGKILFLEEIGENLYHIDRMMWALKKANVFEDINGLIIGHFSDPNVNTTPYFESLNEVLEPFLNDFQKPILMGFPAGHENHNLPLIFGAKARMNIDEKSARIVLI